MVSSTQIQRPYRGLGLVGRTLRQYASSLTMQSVAAIQRTVSQYAPSASGNRTVRVRKIIVDATQLFCERLEKGAHSPQTLRSITQFAFEAAVRGESLNDFSSAIDTAAATTHRFVHELISAGELPDDLEGRIGFAIDAFTQELKQWAEQGHLRGLTELRRNYGDTRRQLALALLTDMWDQRCEALAAAVGWTTPSHVLVVSMDVQNQSALPLDDIPHLHVSSGTEYTILCDASVSRQLKAIVAESSVAYAAATTVRTAAEIAHAGIETRTLIQRLRNGAVEPRKGRWHECRDYLDEIVLATVPTQHGHVTDRLLQPLNQYPSAQRRRLLNTLRAILSHGENANCIAAEVGIHPQTARRHQRQLKPVMENLHSPTHRLLLLQHLDDKTGP